MRGAVMASKQTWVETTRAEALATIYLTRRADLDVIPVARHERRSDYDLLVRISNLDLPYRPEFGVSISGTRTTLHDGLRQCEERFFQIEENSSEIPVCLFVFNVKTEQGAYCWLLKPFVDANSSPRLESLIAPRSSGAQSLSVLGRKTPSWARLDDDAIDQIVQEVIDWTVASHWEATKSDVSHSSKNTLNIAVS